MTKDYICKCGICKKPLTKEATLDLEHKVGLGWVHKKCYERRGK